MQPTHHSSAFFWSFIFPIWTTFVFETSFHLCCPKHIHQHCSSQTISSMHGHFYPRSSTGVTMALGSTCNINVSPFCWLLPYLMCGIFWCTLPNETSKLTKVHQPSSWYPNSHHGWYQNIYALHLSIHDDLDKQQIKFFAVHHGTCWQWHIWNLKAFFSSSVSHIFAFLMVSSIHTPSSMPKYCKQYLIQSACQGASCDATPFCWLQRSCWCWPSLDDE